MASSLLGTLSAFASSCTWAIGVTAYARLERDVPPWAVNASRALVALPAFVVLAVLSLGPAGFADALAGLGSERALFLVLSMVGSYGIGDALFLRGAGLIGPPAALALASLYPLPAALFGLVARGESLGPLRWLGLGSVVLGTVLVILAAGTGTSTRGSRKTVAAGATFSVAAALLWALNAYAVAEGSRGTSPAVASAVRMASGLVLAPLLAPALAPIVRRDLKPLFVPWTLFRKALPFALAECVLGTLFYTYGLTHTPLAVGAALSSLAPVVAVPVALLMRTERFSPRRTIGIVLVVAGVIALV